MARGKTKGATSFVNIDMDTLSKYFGPNNQIPVSRTWLRRINIEVQSMPPVVIQVAQKNTSEEKIEMTLTA